MTTKGKVLVLVSSGRGLPLKDGKVYAGAGYYLNELTVPVRALMKEGYEITFANPKGNTPQLDVNSATAPFFGGDEAKLQDYLKFKDSLTGLKNPTRISDVIASGLDQYDAVFVPGGHGPMIDLLDDPNAGIVMRHFHETSKPTAVLCHGPISLLSALPNSTEVVAALAVGDAAGARAKAQGWIYSGYKMTIFSTAEEQQREPLEIGGKVLFYPDFALRTAGGDVSVVAPWGSYVLQDRELISGQNPFSDEALLKLLLPALDAKKKSSRIPTHTSAQPAVSYRATLFQLATIRKPSRQTVLMDTFMARASSAARRPAISCRVLRSCTLRRIVGACVGFILESLPVFGRKAGTHIDAAVQYTLGCLQKLFTYARFQYVSSPTRLKRGLYICGTRMHRDEYKLHAGQAFLDLPCGVDTVQQRHRDVRYDQVRSRAQRRLHQGTPVRHGPDDLVMRC